MTTALACGIVLAPAPAPAAGGITTSTWVGTLSVYGDAGANIIEVGCISGFVKVNEVDPDDGPLACAALTGLNIYGYEESDIVFATSMAAATSPSLSSVIIDGGPGDDELYGSPVSDTLMGGTGNDNLYPGPGGGSVSGGDGNDYLNDTRVNKLTLTDSVFSEGGIDISISGIERAGFDGTDGNDRLNTTGFSFRVYLAGMEGDDLLRTGKGGDRLSGGLGNDTIKAGAGADKLMGEEGADALYGGPGTDNCRGGPGPDSLFGCP